MKVLWIVTPFFPYPAEQMGLQKTVFGGWLNSLHEELIKNKEIEIAIASTYKGKEFKRYNDKRTIYYLLPDSNPEKYNLRLIKYWEQVIADFNPDIVHIHGTEYPRGLAFINTAQNIPIVVSIQGLIHRCYSIWYANLPYNKLIKNLTVRDILKPMTGYLSHISAKKRGIYEIDILKKADGIIGRTTWDYASSWAINSNLNYYHGDECLRNAFYHNEWDYEKMQKHTIFISQAQAPLKGFHLFLEALYILKKDYPDIKVRISGNNIFSISTLKDRIKIQSYTKYLKKQIKKNDLGKNIEFTGYLDENKMVDELKRCHVFVQASAIENSSNSLCEAMILGVPCVASNVGGTEDMLEHKEEGFLFPFTETSMMALYIKIFFDNKETCIKYGQAARKRAMIRHDRNKNFEETMNTYKSVVNAYKKYK